MVAMPLELTLEISPRARLDLVDVDKQIADTHGDVLGDSLGPFTVHTTPPPAI